MTTLDAVLAAGAVRSVLQPIVDLASGAVVAYEALARGPEGTPLERPDLLFAEARRVGRLAELDELCRRTALRAAVDHGVLAPLTLFVNVEPEVLDVAPLDDLLAIADEVPGRVQVVMEITERSLAARPAELLRTVERVRSVGWRVALDDVGAEDLSLAFMPLLRPEVVKLDLRLVQQRPGPAIAEIMNAVNAYAERSGAVVLAEGIEDAGHLKVARALGARLGQGWLFGRPAAAPAAHLPHGELRLPVVDDADWTGASPFSCLPVGAPLRRSSKALLIEVSKHLERDALRLGPTCVVAAAFQEERNFTPQTAQRYRELVERTGFVAALGEGLDPEPVRGVRGAVLDPVDPVRGEWDIVVLSPHFAAALLAHDLGDTGPDAERMFEFALTYDRDTVVRAAQALLGRVVPQLPAVAASAAAARPRGPAAPAGAPDGVEAALPVGAAPADVLLRRALAATTSGITIADVTVPDAPLVYVNTAFERLAGLRAEHVLGRNCRFLQSDDTDPAAVRRIREAIAEGREHTETLLNVRGPERTPWWNEVHLAPVFDDSGRLLQYIGVQTDVTARVDAERALVQERNRVQQYAVQVEQLAFHDALTGLPNRRRAALVLDDLLTRASGGAGAVLFLDLDGFKAVNDSLGHAVGDAVIVEVADRLRAALRSTDVVARIGGDEFLAVLPDLDPVQAQVHAERAAAAVGRALQAPLPCGDGTLRLSATIGIALWPSEAVDADELLRLADVRMYAQKQRAVRVPVQERRTPAGVTASG